MSVKPRLSKNFVYNLRNGCCYTGEFNKFKYFIVVCNFPSTLIM